MAGIEQPAPLDLSVWLNNSASTVRAELEQVNIIPFARATVRNASGHGDHFDPRN